MQKNIENPPSPIMHSFVVFAQRMHRKKREKLKLRITTTNVRNSYPTSWLLLKSELSAVTNLN